MDDEEIASEVERIHQIGIKNKNIECFQESKKIKQFIAEARASAVIEWLESEEAAILFADEWDAIKPNERMVLWRTFGKEIAAKLRAEKEVVVP